MFVLSNKLLYSRRGHGQPVPRPLPEGPEQKQHNDTQT